MVNIFFWGGFVTWLISIFTFVGANSAPQQSVGAELFIAASVLMVGGQIIQRMEKANPNKTPKTTDNSDSDLGVA